MPVQTAAAGAPNRRASAAGMRFSNVLSSPDAVLAMRLNVPPDEMRPDPPNPPAVGIYVVNNLWTGVWESFLFRWGFAAARRP